MHVSRLGEELVLWASEEVGFVELSDAFTSGSSMLPQKKNPDAAELARAKASRVVADYTGLQTLLAKLPLAYNKDLQEDKHFLFDAIDTLDVLLPALSGMLAEANFRTDRMAAACQDGYLAATDLADHLVRAGWPFRRAHEAVGMLVRACLARGVGLADAHRRRDRRGGPRGRRPARPERRRERRGQDLLRRDRRASGCRSSWPQRAPRSRDGEPAGRGLLRPPRSRGRART